MSSMEFQELCQKYVVFSATSLAKKKIIHGYYAGTYEQLVFSYLPVFPSNFPHFTRTYIALET